MIVTQNMARARGFSDEGLPLLLGQKMEHRRTEDLFINSDDEGTSRYVEGRLG